MINNLPQIGASFDKINLTMRHKKQRPCRHGATSQNEECRTVSGTPSVCPYPPPLHRTDPVKARPAPVGGGRFISALTGAGRWSTLPRGQTLVSAAISGGAVSGALLPSAGRAKVPGAFGGWRGRQPLSSRTPSTPAAGF